MVNCEAEPTDTNDVGAVVPIPMFPDWNMAEVVPFPMTLRRAKGAVVPIPMFPPVVNMVELAKDDEVLAYGKYPDVNEYDRSSEALVS